MMKRTACLTFCLLVLKHKYKIDIQEVDKVLGVKCH